MHQHSGGGASWLPVPSPVPIHRAAAPPAPGLAPPTWRAPWWRAGVAQARPLAAWRRGGPAPPTAPAPAARWTARRRAAGRTPTAWPSSWCRGQGPCSAHGAPTGRPHSPSSLGWPGNAAGACTASDQVVGRVQTSKLAGGRRLGAGQRREAAQGWLTRREPNRSISGASGLLGRCVAAQSICMRPPSTGTAPTPSLSLATSPQRGAAD